MDDFSDDELNDLSDNVLQELENNAIQFTQAQRKSDSQATQTAHIENYDGLEFEDDDLDDTEVTNELLPPVTRPAADKSIPHQPRSAGPSIPPQQRWNNTSGPSNPPARSSIPRYPPPISSHAPFLASQRFQPPPAPPHRPQATQFARPAPPARYDHPQTQVPPGAPSSTENDVVAALNQRLKALESELYSAKGEVAIIRSNSTKAQQDHAAEVTRLKKQNEEQVAKQERLIEAAVAAEKTASTELRFLQRDMKEVSTKARRRETVPVGGGNGTTTPKKAAKSWGIADGFDDMDVVISPSKAKGKTRDTGPVAIPLAERTPTKGKRKRPAMDSPVMALDIQEDVTMDDGPVVALPIAYSVPSSNSLPFEFLPLVLDHGPIHGEPPTFDMLARYSYSSDPNTSFASLIFQKLPLMGNPFNPMQLLIDFSRYVISMWSQCLDEGLIRPIWDLTSLLGFTLQLQTMSVAPYIINELVPVAHQTIYLVAEPRYKSVDGDISGDPNTDALQQQIDATYILSLLWISSAACMTTTESEDGATSRLVVFWQLMPVDVVLVLLTPKQRLDDIVGMLDLLCTSALPESIGPILADNEPSLARILIDKVSANLVELPRLAVTPRQKHAIRLAVLRTLTAFVRSPYGALRVAEHAGAIPRLVVTLSGAVDELYEISSPYTHYGSSSGVSQGSTRLTDSEFGDVHQTWDEDIQGIYQIIAQTVFLLHTLVTEPKTTETANILSKLAMSHGGSQRYILSLARLSFAEENGVFEEGIGTETGDLAHELLELAVTPVEGDAVEEAFKVPDSGS